MTREDWTPEQKKMAGNVCRRLKANIVLIDGEYQMDYSNVVPFDVKQRCFLEADGFGRVKSLREIEEMEYDWSHVRDSSLDAFIRMNAIIEAWDDSLTSPEPFDWWVVAHDRVQKIRENGF